MTVNYLMHVIEKLYQKLEELRSYKSFSLVMNLGYIQSCNCTIGISIVNY
jgi:hypothetical protein